MNISKLKDQGQFNKMQYIQGEYTFTISMKQLYILH